MTTCTMCGAPWDGDATAPGGGALCIRCAADERLRFAANAPRDRVAVAGEPQPDPEDEDEDEDEAAEHPGVCEVCGGPADGPDDAARVQCDCGAVVCSACCVAFDGESYCPQCAKDKAEAAGEPPAAEPARVRKRLDDDRTLDGEPMVCPHCEHHHDTRASNLRPGDVESCEECEGEIVVPEPAPWALPGCIAAAWQTYGDPPRWGVLVCPDGGDPVLFTEKIGRDIGDLKGEAVWRLKALIARRNREDDPAGEQSDEPWKRVREALETVGGVSLKESEARAIAENLAATPAQPCPECAASRDDAEAMTECANRWEAQAMTERERAESLEREVRTLRFQRETARHEAERAQAAEFATREALAAANRERDDAVRATERALAKRDKTLGEWREESRKHAERFVEAVAERDEAREVLAKVEERATKMGAAIRNSLAILEAAYPYRSTLEAADALRKVRALASTQIQTDPSAVQAPSSSDPAKPRAHPDRAALPRVPRSACGRRPLRDAPSPHAFLPVVRAHVAPRGCADGRRARLPRPASAANHHGGGRDMIRVHHLKTWSPMWDAIYDGRKTFDLRKDDRRFQVGDELVLVRVSDSAPHEPTDSPPRVLRRQVSYILHDGFGLQPGHVCLGLALPVPTPRSWCGHQRTVICALEAEHEGAHDYGNISAAEARSRMLELELQRAVRREEQEARRAQELAAELDAIHASSKAEELRRDLEVAAMDEGEHKKAACEASGNAFEPTHRIVWLRATRQLLELCMPDADGPAYTREEWENNEDAQWTFDGEWCYRGEPQAVCAWPIGARRTIPQQERIDELRRDLAQSQQEVMGCYEREKVLQEVVGELLFALGHCQNLTRDRDDPVSGKIHETCIAATKGVDQAFKRGHSVDLLHQLEIELRRLRATPCPTMAFGFTPDEVATSVKTEVDEVTAEPVGSEAAQVETAGVIAVAVHLAIIHGANVKQRIHEEILRLRARIDHVQAGGTWASAKALEHAGRGADPQ